MGNSVCRFPETLDQVQKKSAFVSVYLCLMAVLTQTGSGLSFMRSLQRFLPAVGLGAHTNSHTHTHTHTQLVFLSLVTLAGLWRLCMVFTSTHPHLFFHLNWLPTHPSPLSLHIFSSSFTSHISSFHFHERHQVTKVLNSNLLVFSPSTCHGHFRTVMSECTTPT